MDDAAFAAACKAAAPDLDFSASGVQKWRLGQRIPDRERMPVIAQVTESAVTANDFYGLAPSIAAAESPEPASSEASS